MDNNKNKVLELFISVTSDEKRVNKNSIIVDENGVIGDKFYSKNSDRLILITSTYAYKLARDNYIELNYGDLGENILIDADLTMLKPFDRFQIGKVIFEVTQNCTLCKGLTTLSPKLPKLLKDDRGIFVKTINSGRIDINDEMH